MTVIFSLISISFTKTATAATLSSADQAAIDSAPTGLNMSDYFTIMNPTNNLSSDHFRFRSNSAFFSETIKLSFWQMVLQLIQTITRLMVF